MTLRKNFLLDDEIAKKENRTQTDVIKSMIEEKYEKYSTQEKIEVFNRLKGCMSGLIGEDVSIQSIKLEIGSQI